MNNTNKVSFLKFHQKAITLKKNLLSYKSYVLTLTIECGIPVGVLKAGNNLSATFEALALYI